MAYNALHSSWYKYKSFSTHKVTEVSKKHTQLNFSHGIQIVTVQNAIEYSLKTWTLSPWQKIADIS